VASRFSISPRCLPSVALPLHPGLGPLLLPLQGEAEPVLARLPTDWKTTKPEIQSGLVMQVSKPTVDTFTSQANALQSVSSAEKKNNTLRSFVSERHRLQHNGLARSDNFVSVDQNFDFSTFFDGACSPCLNSPGFIWFLCYSLVRKNTNNNISIDDR
jgi:hypothetical protein